MFERRSEPLLPTKIFLRRVASYFALAIGIVVGSLALGMMGYHSYEGLPWIDSFLNSAMLLGGMGPVNEIHTKAGKIFAGMYALYCGLVVLVIAGVLFAPLFHRFIHRFHLDLEETENTEKT